MKKVIIVHGFKSSPNSGWKPWLRKELENNDFKVEIPEMPGTDHPEVDVWVRKIADTVRNRESDELYLVGHSLGCLTILKYLETSNANKIKASIFVAGFTKKFKGYNGGHDNFFENKLNWELIKKNCEHFIALHSKDDVNVPMEELQAFKNHLEAQTIVMDGFGHFGSAEGVFELPALRDAILKIAE